MWCYCIYLNFIRNLFSKFSDTIDKVCIFCNYGAKTARKFSFACLEGLARATMGIEGNGIYIDDAREEARLKKNVSHVVSVEMQ